MAGLLCQSLIGKVQQDKKMVATQKFPGKCQSLIGKVQQQYLCCLFIYNISFFSNFQSFFSKKSVNLFWHYRCKSPIFKHFYFCEKCLRG